MLQTTVAVMRRRTHRMNMGGALSRALLCGRLPGVGLRGQLALITVVIAALGAPAVARERLLRTLDERQGLEVAVVPALAQDSTGLLWIGTPGGLVRYDGRELRNWARHAISTEITVIRAAPDGSLYVVDSPGNLYHVEGERAELVGGASAVETLVVAQDGSLWVVDRGSLRRRATDGQWLAPIAGLDHVHRIRLTASGELWAASRHKIWRLRDPTHPVAVAVAVEVADLDGIVDLLPAPDGSVRVELFDGHTGRIVSIDGNQRVELASLPTRPIEMCWRGSVLWASFDTALVALRPGAPPEVLGRDQGIRSGGPLLVDREGSLWMGTFQGVVQLPEPETWSWSEQDGLPTGPRFLAQSGGAMWVATWKGLGAIDLATGRARRENDYAVRTAMCPDGQGELWTSDQQSILDYTRGAWRSHRFSGPIAGFPEGCTSAPDGAVWLSVNDGIYYTRPDAREPVPVPGPAAMPESTLGYHRVFALYADQRHRLWASKADLACTIDLAGTITAAAWTCARIPGAHLIRRFIETESGSMWAATDESGIHRLDERTATWTPIPGSRALASRKILGLARSPRGGTWVAGTGILIRVVDRPGSPDGWSVVERLSAWHGLASIEAEDVVEDADGTLWLAQLSGVIRVARTTRDSQIAPPPVTLLEVRVNGTRQSAAAVVLPYRNNHLELDFAALSYRDPGRLRYRVRLNHDEAWSNPTSQPSFRFVDLPPGAYAAEVSATLDGEHWSASPATIEFRVQRPWYLERWAIALFLVAGLATAYAAHRLRLGFHLRLERQRARIAMDLHDEVGSALGSIGILASLGSTNTLAEPARRDLMQRIATTAGEVSESMSDIVWSLRRGSTTLAALMTYLADRGAGLFPDRPRLERRFPAPLPDQPLSLAVCRNVQLIVLEALHNAAQHASATRVVLGLERSGRDWRLWVDDDGTGIAIDPADPAGPSGLGLTSMRRRATDIGAELFVGPGIEGGTRVELTFAAQATERTGSHDHGSDGST